MLIVMPTTTIPVKRETWARLRSYKVGGATYDDVLNDLMDDRPPAGFIREHLRRLKVRRARAGPPAAGRSGALCEGSRAAGAGSEAPAWPRRKAPSRNEGCLATADRVVPRDLREGGRAAALHAVRAPEGRLPFLSRLSSIKAFRSACARDSPTPSRTHRSFGRSGIRGGTSGRTTCATTARRSGSRR